MWGEGTDRRWYLLRASGGPSRPGGPGASNAGSSKFTLFSFDVLMFAQCYKVLRRSAPQKKAVRRMACILESNMTSYVLYRLLYVLEIDSALR